MCVDPDVEDCDCKLHAPKPIKALPDFLLPLTTLEALPEAPTPPTPPTPAS
jgi:hypothetical protein